MTRAFQLLTQTHVTIDDGSGEHTKVPMLPVTAIADMEDIAKLDDANKMHQKLEELCKTVLPEKYHPNLKRFPLLKLSELAAYLTFGDDSQEIPDSKKN